MKLTKNTNKISANEPSIANAPVKKQIGFFSAMLVVIGSCVGSGIFFKTKTVLNNSWNSIILGTMCWLFVAIAVIFMALALIEIASVRNDNLSILGWSRSFNNRFIYKIMRNYIMYLYTPIRGFFLPVYTIMAFQDAAASIYLQQGIPYNGFGTNADWAIIMAIGLFIAGYFIITTAYSVKLGNVQNWIITSVKFFPLIIAAIIGFVAFGMNNGVVSPNYQPGFNPMDVEPTFSSITYYNTFSTVSAGLGFFIAASAILYAFDGFYASAGIKTQMKKPEKISSAILVGLIVTTIIYLTIAISMSLGSANGSPQGLVSFFAKNNILPLYSFFQLAIAIGIFGVANGYYMFANQMIIDLAYDAEVPFSKFAANWMMKRKNGEKEVAVMYNLFISIPFVIVLCTIGGLAYINAGYEQGVLASLSELPDSLKNVMGGLANSDGLITYQYGTGVGSLYEFTDMVSSWSALFIFMFIALILYGGISNRKHEVIKTTKSKYFMPTAIISLIFIAIPVVMTFVEPFVNLFLLIPMNKQLNDNNLLNVPENITTLSEITLSRIMAAVMMIIYWAIMLLPTIFEDLYSKKKYGSIKNADLIKFNNVQKILNLKEIKSYKEYDNQIRHISI